MAAEQFHWGSTFNGRTWVAELRLSNSTARSHKNPRLRITAFPDFAVKEAPRIEIWEAPLNIAVDQPIDVLVAMISVSSVLYSRVMAGDLGRYPE